MRIEPHGRTLRVTPDEPLLAAALAAGLNLPHSCKSGHCGSCRARLRHGTIVYPALAAGAVPLGLTAAEAAQGNILLCQARATSDLVVEARLIARVSDVEIKTLPCRIARLTPLAADVMQVVLRLPAVERLNFQAGQYLDVLLEGGRRRSFSIASPPHDSETLELHVRRVAGGGFTQRFFGGTAQAPAFKVGSLLRIEGPVGQFVWREGEAPVLMVAGGTGFAPLKSMLRHLLERGAARPVHLYWGARHTADLYEDETVRTWVRHHPQLRYSAVLSEASAAEGAHHRTGWVHEAVLADYPDLSGFEVYAAGPPAMIEALRRHFPPAGLDPARLYFDSFDYAPDALARR
ncbi:MAG: 2Fe-2S iron-sulfur cluster binding domain-containing protein [Proteobacteria bacterium]|nr:2Fe-2S iron-sulfur cluster binding domain-containing protein [Pseudomonadota bacterium]